MITRQDDISCAEEYLEIMNVSGEECIFFDIETTGFRAGTSHVYLIGAAFKSGDTWKRIQWLSERPQDESELLRVFAAFLRPFRVMIHFNGDRFDIPYLTEKYAQYGLASPFTAMRSVDIFRDLRVLRSFLCLEHMNQKSLEQFIHLNRDDQYDAGRLISVYRDYTVSHDKTLLALLLLHNAEDVAGMMKLIRLYAYLYALTELPEQIEVDSQDAPGTEPSQGIRTLIRFHWRLPVPVPVPVTRLSDSFHVTMEGYEVSILVPLLHGQLLYFFDNYKDYYYLPKENQAIHKSVAAYVDKAYRTKATRQTCYVRREGDYLPQPWEMFKPSLRRSYDDPITWFELPDPQAVSADPNLSRQYCRMILESCMHNHPLSAPRPGS